MISRQKNRMVHLKYQIFIDLLVQFRRKLCDDTDWFIQLVDSKISKLYTSIRKEKQSKKNYHLLA